MRICRRRNINRPKVGQVIRISIERGGYIAAGAINAMSANLTTRMPNEIKFNSTTNYYVRQIAKHQGFGFVIRQDQQDKTRGIVPMILFKNEKAFMLFKLKWCYRD